GKKAREERQRGRAGGAGAAGFGGGDEAGNRREEFGLLGKDPPDPPPPRPRRCLPARRAEWARLRQRGIERAGQQQQPGNRDEEQNEMNDRSRHDGFHGYFTTISLTYAETILRLGSLCLVLE